MPTWFNALGTGAIGVVYGYVLFYILKRYLPPIAQQAPTIKELLLLPASVGAGGVIGTAFVSLDGINFVGSYGLGLLLGSILNIWLQLMLERAASINGAANATVAIATGTTVKKDNA